MEREKLNDPGYTEQWLQPGDVIEMEIDGLGMLSNTIVAEETDWSILKLKKAYKIHTEAAEYAITT